MTPLHRRSHLVLWGLLSTGACSSTPAAKPVTPASRVAMQAALATLPSPTPMVPTTTQIHIDDEILKACGIKADKAFFPFDSAKLEPSDDGPLNDVARCFTAGPLKSRTLRLIGHADPRGEHEYNMVLGQSRADTVGSFLKSKGLDKGRMNTTSRGAMDANGKDEPSWAKDRRVDVLLGS